MGLSSVNMSLVGNITKTKIPGILQNCTKTYEYHRKSENEINLPQHFREPLAMIAIRSPSSSASSIEWVVSKIILPFLIFFINCQVKRIEYGSIPLVGSSRTITCQVNPKDSSFVQHIYIVTCSQYGSYLTVSNQCNSERQFPLHATRESSHYTVNFISQAHLFMQYKLSNILRWLDCFAS